MAAVEIDLKDNSDFLKNATEEGVHAALVAIAHAAELHAKEKCPVDTGRLRNSISNTVKGDTAYIGTNVFYAPYVELGTSKMPAQPFLRPAVKNYTWDYRRIAIFTLAGYQKDYVNTKDIFDQSGE